MKKLPKVYQHEFNKKINNNKEVCFLREEPGKIIEPSTTINETITEIFSGIGYSYNIPVIIKTTNKVYETNLISKTKNNLITLDNEVIPIEEIISIKKIKNK